ncbi:MAG TPA: monovalent cation/H+ antiporter complex subunit F [Mycobacteriales bacterium]|nr:monovalent cation/H+ antiporter complex subunit F [Mycobacteriales bacterium]
MNPWLAATAVLLAGGLAPALILGSRGSSVHRLIGLELAGAVTTVAMLLLSQAVEQSSYLIAPLVLALMSFAGTLVYTRLLGPPS